MTHIKYQGMKLTNTSEARNYIAQHKAMVRYHKVNKIKSTAYSLFKGVMITLTISGILFAGYEYTRLNNPLIKIQIQEKEVLIDNLTPKVDTLKAEVLDILRTCESNGATEDTGLIVFDSNKVASIGLYQFQVKTIKHYYKTLYNQDITGKQAIEIALNATQARKLAEDIIFQDSKGINNWYNCNQKNQLASKIAFINKLTK